MSTAYCTVLECEYQQPHAHCVSCGTANPSCALLCLHHVQGVGDDFAPNNRAMCNFVHRKIEPPRLAPADREEPAIYD